MSPIHINDYITDPGLPELEIDRFVYGAMLLILVQDGTLAQEEGVFKHKHDIPIQRDMPLYLLLKKSNRKRWDDMSFFNFNFENQDPEQTFFKFSASSNGYIDKIRLPKDIDAVGKYVKGILGEFQQAIISAGFKDRHEFALSRLRARMLKEYAFPAQIFQIDRAVIDIGKNKNLFSYFVRRSLTAENKMTFYYFQFYVLRPGDDDQRSILTLLKRAKEDASLKYMTQILAEDYECHITEKGFGIGKLRVPTDLVNVQNTIISEFLKKDICQLFPVELMAPNLRAIQHRKWKFHTALKLLTPKKARPGEMPFIDYCNAEAKRSAFTYGEYSDETKEKCAVFIDLIGFGKLFDEENWKKSHTIQKAFLLDIVRIFDHYGLYVEMFAGDGLFAMQDKDQTPEQIVELIVDLLRLPFPIRGGIAFTSEFPRLYEGLIAPLHYKQPVYSGKAVNIAARLEHLVKARIKNLPLYKSGILTLPYRELNLAAAAQKRINVSQSEFDGWQVLPKLPVRSHAEVEHGSSEAVPGIPELKIDGKDTTLEGVLILSPWPKGENL